MKDNLQMIVAWAWFTTVWMANINDLIRGDWFYYGWESVLICNFFGLIAFYIITVDLHERGEKNK